LGGTQDILSDRLPACQSHRPRRTPDIGSRCCATRKRRLSRALHVGMRNAVPWQVEWLVWRHANLKWAVGDLEPYAREDIVDTSSFTHGNPLDIRVSFPGGKKVDAVLGPRVIRTDQSAGHGGAGTAPEPFELFLASLATCAGFYVLSFCQSRGIPTDGIELVQHHRFDDITGRLSRVELMLTLPPAFPEKSRAAVLQAAAACKVKKLLMAPPEVVVTAREAKAAA